MSLRVLIADDAGFVREILRNCCESLGLIVVGEAMDGEQVLEMAGRLKPDVILLDLVMPKLNGLEVTNKVLESLPETSIVAVSSLDDEMVFKQAQDMGCKAFLRKPFQKQSLKVIFQQIQASKKGSKYA